MSKVSRSRKRAAEVEYEPEQASVTSILFGLMMVTALIVAGAAFMGGSLSKIETRFANAIDGAARTVGLSVDYISVVGVEGDLADSVRMAAMIEPGENMFRADPHVIRKRVEATRRVVNVQVYRLWPDQIQIHAYAAEPVALWSNGQRWAVVDMLGREMVGADIGAHATLVKLTGQGGSDAAPTLMTALKATPALKARIAIAERIENRRWDVTFDSGVTVSLPLDADLPEAIGRLAALQQTRKILDRPVKSLDLRLKDRIFIKPATAGSASLASLQSLEDV